MLLTFTVSAGIKGPIQVTVSGLAADRCNTAVKAQSFDSSTSRKWHIDGDFVQTEMGCEAR